MGVGDAVRKADMGSCDGIDAGSAVAVRDIRQLGDMETCRVGHGCSVTPVRSVT